jgi:hypothetical protein
MVLLEDGKTAKSEEEVAGAAVGLDGRGKRGWVIVEEELDEERERGGVLL